VKEFCRLIVEINGTAERFEITTECYLSFHRLLTETMQYPAVVSAEILKETNLNTEQQRVRDADNQQLFERLRKQEEELKKQKDQLAKQEERLRQLTQDALQDVPIAIEVETTETYTKEKHQ
jgi:hypothetical protein